ncbi:MAG: hypothetical protein AMXMBFR55_19870 [Gemmatimonadota bacterium]
MKRQILAAFAASLLPLAGAQAQACLGLSSLATNSTNLTVGGLFTSGAKAIDARFGLGSSIAFGGVSAQLRDIDHVDGTAKSVAIDGGLSYMVGTRKNVAVCPVGTLGYVNYPDVEVLGGSYGSSETYGTAGIAIGSEVGTSSTLRLIPFAALQAAYTRFTVDVAGGTESDTETFGILSGGLSFVLTPTFLIRPHISLPFGVEDADPTYGVGFSFAFGRR